MPRCVKGFGGDFGQLAKIRYNWAGGWWLVAGGWWLVK